MNSPKTGPGDAELRQAAAACRSAWAGIAVASGFVNLLMLTGAIFMLQVYDRVLPSRSLPTLVGLCLFALALYVFQAWFDVLRGRLLARAGRRFDEAINASVFETLIQSGLGQRDGAGGMQPLRDLDTLRGFLSGMGLGAFFDLPWLPVYVAICFLFHPWIGLLVLAGTGLLCLVTILADRTSRTSVREAVQMAATRRSLAEAAHTNAELLHALGMRGPLLRRWRAATGDYLDRQQKSSDLASGFGSASRLSRMVLQSAVLALGAWLVIQQQASAGVMLAATILSTRAIAPVDLVVANWNGFIAARQSWRRLADALNDTLRPTEVTPLPRPSRELRLTGVSVAPPRGADLVLHEITLTLPAGSVLGVIGPSGSGKSSLARALVGAWRPLRGVIRLDGAAYDQHLPDDLGRQIGYLPQDINLLAGTVAENISRFDADVDPEALMRAAAAAGVQGLVVGLPKGFDTPVGEGGVNLSGGQRQRIALARALYGEPFLVVLDEPNSNLDSEGERALMEAIVAIRQRRGIVVVITHRPATLAVADRILILNAGRIQAFGPRQAIVAELARLQGGPPPPPDGPEPEAARVAPRPKSTKTSPARRPETTMEAPPLAPAADIPEAAPLSFAKPAKPPRTARKAGSPVPAGKVRVNGGQAHGTR